MLEVHRTDLTRALMPPLPLAEDVGATEDGRTGVLAADEITVLHELVLRIGEEAHGYRVDGYCPAWPEVRTS